MKFKFSKNLEYQKEAIDAIVGIFDTGRNIIGAERDFELHGAGAIVANELELDEKRILKNIELIQRTNHIDSTSQTLGSMDFSIEMETGTGKTYVYLRTVMELFQRYGLKKFIILVPSVAIREGVLKTIEQTKSHFYEIYGNGFEYFDYDSSKLGKVRQFANSPDVQIMIMTIQSFNSDDRVMRQTPDRFNGESPLDLVAGTRPVVIMDEPQNMESELSRAAISDLNSLFRLRYSATHKELHNLVYRLTPVEAYRQNLVKKIQVYGIKGDDSNALLIKVRSIDVKKGESPKARILVEVKHADGSYGPKEMLFKAGDDLQRTTRNDAYEGLAVTDVNMQYGRVELSDSNYYKLEAETENKTEIFRTQIRETIKAHLDKQESVGGRIKVLSLFFIDAVANYVPEDSLIRSMFTEEFNRLKRKYAYFHALDADAVHKGYFASKKERGQMVAQDTKGNSQIDKEAYDLIMREKERLLSFSEPVSFIFSHSALKEGWDNPNIFQICTLRDTSSVMKKRQEIGRGLRLPVDIHGDRVHDPAINVLTVVANESYKSYVAGLQTEFAEAGYSQSIETTDAHEEKVVVKTTKHIENDDFKRLWEVISQRTVFNLEIDTNRLVKTATEKISGLDVGHLVVTVDKIDVYFDEGGRVETSYAGQAAGGRIERDIRIGNIIDRIARETGITRRTAFQIISNVNNLDLIFENPEEYVRSVVVIVSASLNDQLINSGLKYDPTGQMWEADLLFKDLEVLPSKSVASSKSPYERVVFDSQGEREFAEHLENSQHVKVYTKLPRGFVVDTPLGGYVPDWAIVWDGEDGQKLYLVRETKFGYKNWLQELPLGEQQKILCGKKHFAAIGADFKVSQKSDLSDLK